MTHDHCRLCNASTGLFQYICEDCKGKPFQPFYDPITGSSATAGTYVAYVLNDSKGIV